MKDLKCGLKECKYNKGYSCCSKSINVSAGTDCTTYSPDETKRRVQFEAASDFIPANYSVDTAVGCAARCIYNLDGTCRARRHYGDEPRKRRRRLPDLRERINLHKPNRRGHRCRGGLFVTASVLSWEENP